MLIPPEHKYAPFHISQNIKTFTGQINVRKVLDLCLAGICVSKGLRELDPSTPNTWSLDLRVEISCIKSHVIYFQEQENEYKRIYYQPHVQIK